MENLEQKIKSEKKNGMAKIFVTGCNGFVGAWLTQELVSLGYEIVGLVRDNVKNSFAQINGISTKINTVNGDILDYELLQRIISEYETDTIFHLAAQPIVGIAKNAPRLTFETNIKGTYNILEAARNSKTVKRIVISSSDKAYGSHQKLPYSEDFELKGENPYDVSKSCADLITQSYYKTYELPVAIARCANIYGGGDFNFNRIVPGTMCSLLKNEVPMIRSDGLFVRDYLYIKDAVSAYITLAKELPFVSGEAFNFSTENPVTVLGIVNRIIQVSGKKKISPIILNQASNEIREQYLSSQKAHTRLNWNPRHDMNSALKETWEWYLNYFKCRKLLLNNSTRFSIDEEINNSI